jgi:hypothetical protein
MVLASFGRLRTLGIVFFGAIKHLGTRIVKVSSEFS